MKGIQIWCIENSRVALRSRPLTFGSQGSQQGCLKVGLPGSVAFTMAARGAATSRFEELIFSCTQQQQQQQQECS